MFHCIEGTDVPVNTGKSTTRQLGPVVGLERNDIQPVTLYGQGPGILGRDQQAISDLVIFYNRYLVSRSQRNESFAGVRKRNTDRLIKLGDQRIVHQCLDSRRYLVISGAGWCHIDHADGIGNMISDPQFVTLRMQGQPDRIDTNVYPLHD